MVFWYGILLLAIEPTLSLGLAIWEWVVRGNKWWNRELTLKCKLKCYVKPMKDLLSVSPSQGNQGSIRGKEKILLTSVGIEPTTSGLDLQHKYVRENTPRKIDNFVAYSAPGHLTIG